MSLKTIPAALAAGLGLAAALVAVSGASADNTQVARGKYLVTISGCSDCHTPGYFLGKPDFSRLVGGSEVGFVIPGMGVFVAPNITPDKETGLGNWSEQDIVTAIQTGKRPDGRILAPAMPYHDYAHLTKEDAFAVAAFLKSLPPVHNKVPGPFGPGEKITSFAMPVVPAEVFNAMPPPGAPPK